MQLTDIVLGEELVFHERCFYFELTYAFYFCFDTLKLILGVVVVKFYPMRELLVFQQPEDLKISVCYHRSLWLII